MRHASSLVQNTQDMVELERQHGPGSVQLRLKFKRGLHPFYPPSVELLRPRFCGPLLGALASHPLLQVPVLPAFAACAPQVSFGAWRSARGMCQRYLHAMSDARSPFSARRTPCPEL